jgi:anti-anti-sigma regulatory factor
MSQKFQASVQHRGDVSYVKLGGVIDEDNELNDLVDKIPAGTAVIDLGEIERINSCGVRDWVNWLTKLESNGTRSVLVECSPAIVAQINLVNNFTGNGVVKSFYVPYFCPECDEEKVLLVEASDMGPPPHEPPTCRCDECDLVMDFDDMPDSYFAFLANQKKLAEGDLGGAVQEIARGSDPSAKAKVKSRASQPNLGGPGASAPSVPSLPSIQKTSTQPAKTHSSGPRLPTTKQTSSNPGSKPGSKPGSMPPASKQSSNPLLAAKPPSTPNMSSAMSMRMAAGPPVTAPGKSNAIVFVLIAVLIAAIAVLAYVVLTK